MKKILNRYKPVVILTLILLPAFIGVSLFNYFLQRESVRLELISTSLPLVRELIDWEIESRFQVPLRVASVMANDTFLKNWIVEGEQSPDAVTAYLASIKEKQGFNTAFYVSAASGVYYSHEGVHKTVSKDDSHDIWYYSFLDSGKEVELDVDTDEVTGVLTIFINQRVVSENGKLIGVTGVGLKMESLSELLHAVQDEYGRTIYLVDEQGVIQAHSDMDKIESVSIREMDGVSAIAEKILSRRGTAADFTYSGSEGTVLLTSRYADELEWFIIVEQNEHASMRLIRRNLYTSVLIGLTTSLLIILLSTYFVEKSQKKLVSLTITDHLTGTANRMRLEAVLGQELARSQRYDTLFSVLLIDIDNFKVLNDTYGHAEGDAVLIQFSELLISSIRGTDIFGRWGGDEFMLILPHTILDKALVLAEKIRRSIEGHVFNKRTAVTISIGATVLNHGDTLQQLIKRADDALYRAKETGKNRVDSI
ncbi:MAG: sensor domain-containing diguanylate cyclase [Spirochaetia bacterium]|nr:sensor domain-containing diguanylate cyclase [Spirochaetia bacterium]